MNYTLYTYFHIFYINNCQLTASKYGIIVFYLDKICMFEMWRGEVGIFGGRKGSNLYVNIFFEE